MNDPRPTAAEVQAGIFRRMTPEQRLQCCFRWAEFTCEQALAGIRRQRRDWTPVQIDREIGRRITGIDIEELKRKFAAQDTACDHAPE